MARKSEKTLDLEMEMKYKTIRKIVKVHRILLAVNIVAVLLTLFAGIYWFIGAVLFSIYSWICYRGGCEGEVRGKDSVKKGLDTLTTGWIKLAVVLAVFALCYWGTKW